MTDDQTPTPKRGRGRPPGAKNKTKESLTTAKQLESLYNRVKPYLTGEQQEYVKKVMKGDIDVDVRYEMQLLVRQLSILFSEAAIWYWNEGRISADLAKFADTLRMSIKELNDIERQRANDEQRKSTDDDLVPITGRGAALERFESLFGETDAEGEGGGTR
jgi:hypothetical protein